MPIDVHPIAGVVGGLICIVLLAAWGLERWYARRERLTGKRPPMWLDDDDPHGNA